MKFTHIAWLLIWTQLQPSGAAADIDRFQAYHRLTELEASLVDDLRDGTLEHFSLIESALVAAGHDNLATIQEIKQRFQALAQACRLAIETEGDDQAEAILKSMHSAVLDGEFRPSLSDVGTTIMRGDFNCLTATILYQALCAEFDLEARAEWVPSHVRCWFPARQLGIETTSSTWRTEAVQAGRLLTVPELLGKVFYNRGVTLMRQHQYAPALVATWTSCCLDARDDQAGSNLRACLNNWALDCAERGDVSTAQELLQHGLKIDPAYPPFSRNARYLHGVIQPLGIGFATFD